tara:strand:+ start:2063 stop:3607 length:1545 start_codon:yes stop_codon:yes gene_type:complete
MSNSIKDKITRKPTYSIERTTDKQGKQGWTATYSVEIDGKEYTESSTSSSRNGAMNQVKTNFAIKVSNDYETSGIVPRNIEKVLGSSATRETLAQAQTRQVSTVNATSENGNSSTSPGAESPQTRSESQKLSDRQGPQTRENKKTHTRSEKQKNHLPWKTQGDNQLDGKGDFILHDYVPEYLVRPGEKNIKAGIGGKSQHINANIIIGQDNSPLDKQIFQKDSSNRDYTSRYGGYMCSAAIDIVVGRMAPFPLKKISQLGDIVCSPSFNTEYPPELANEMLLNGKHPGFMMDAARIYISQMTDVDENFKITTEVSAASHENQGSSGVDPESTKWQKKKLVPTSAIMLKSDKFRIHSRQDVKIVTGGPNELYNSLGNRIRQNNGIHLIAENGLDKNGNVLPQQPMVLGYNLIKVLEHYGLLIEDAVQAMDAMTSIQMNFNAIIANNFDLIPIPSGTTIPNPFKKLAGIITQLELLVKTRFGSLFQLINNFNLTANYLRDTGENQNFILSRYNTVN